MSVLWRLDVTSFRGMSIGASHYYGKLRRDRYRDGALVGVSCEVERVLTAAEARTLSAKDDYTWRAGYTSGRFDTRDDLVAAAVAAWPVICEPGDVLVLTNGSSASGEPCRPLAGPDEFVAAAAALFAALEELEAEHGYYTYKAPGYDELCGRWADLVAPYAVQRPAGGYTVGSPESVESVVVRTEVGFAPAPADSY